MNEIVIHRQLASLQTSVEHLTSTIKDMATQWASQENSAALGRKGLHEKVEMVRQEIGVQVAGLSLRVDRLTDQVKVMEPMVTTLKNGVKEYEDEALRDEGAKRLKKYIWAGAGTIMGGLGWGLHEVIGYFKH